MSAQPMRSEVEGVLSGPAHPIPDQSLDCGYGQLQCPKLAKYATRKLFVGLVCWIGIVQAAAQTYYGLTSTTFARRFQIETNIVEWLSLITDGIFPFMLALPVAYWGDRIHRAAWTGALVLLQSVGFIFLIIPHFTSSSSSRVIEETSNATYLSMYAEENPELCFITGLTRMSIDEEDSNIIGIVIIIIAQIFNCMGNIVYLSLTISYLDDNTRKRQVSVPISFIIAMKIIGILFGYLLAWTCLRIDSNDLNFRITSYREQIGAWWLGWPILSILLAIGGLPMSWMPRRLTSEIVEQAAASILDHAGCTSPTFESTVSNNGKYGDTSFLKSLSRLVRNKILMCNIFASSCCLTGLVNFANNEDIYLESRFYVPRPTGLYLGFNDPLLSRIITIILRPIMMGLVIIAAGIIILKFRPRVKCIVGYNIIISTLATIIIITLVFLTCQKPPIAGTNRNGSITLLRYCNKNCQCSKDANFSPICDRENSFIFYTPCHAGCKTADDTADVKKFRGCSCIEEISGIQGNNEATEGPCGSITCQYGWIVFEVSTLLTYSFIASGAVGSLLIGLRSIYIQDKALAIGLWITITSILIHIIGKMIYWKIVDWTCIQRGYLSYQCHLHDPHNLGGYLAYLTALLLVIGVFFELLTFLFCQNLTLYRDTELNPTNVIENQTQTIPLMNEIGNEADENNPNNNELNSTITPTTTMSIIFTSPSLNTENDQVNQNDHATPESSQVYAETKKANGPLQYGPQGPGNPHKTIELSVVNNSCTPVSDTDFTDDEQPNHYTNKRVPISLSTISYRYLKTDSDDETSVSSINERINFHRDNESPEQNSNSSSIINHTVAGFSRTDDIEFTKFEKRPRLIKRKLKRPYTGDFNEVGIPIVNYPLTSMNSHSIGSILMGAKWAKNNYDEMVTAHNCFEKSLSLGGHTSSGFGSSTSDLYKNSTIQNIEIGAVPERKSNRQYLPAFTTDL